MQFQGFEGDETFRFSSYSLGLRLPFTWETGFVYLSFLCRNLFGAPGISIVVHVFTRHLTDMVTPEADLDLAWKVVPDGWPSSFISNLCCEYAVNTYSYMWCDMI